MENFDQVAQEAALLGITIVVASGDSGSTDGANDGQNHVDFPASSPHVLAVGGTRLLAANGVITGETVWNDRTAGGATGGGFSNVFTVPTGKPPSSKPTPIAVSPTLQAMPTLQLATTSSMVRHLSSAGQALWRP